MHEEILIRNGRIIDPSRRIDGIGSVLVRDGKIARVIIGDAGQPDAAVIIDAAGMVVMPGLVDMHTHLREPGYEHKETIRTGTLAAVRGGFTVVCPMPNTNPANDNPTVTAFILRKAADEGFCRVRPIGAITKGQLGKELAEIGLMHEAGCVAFSDDGRPVMNSLMMRRALEYAKRFSVPIISHCEDVELAEGGVMNEGALATHLGLRGMPAAAEDVMVARDCLLAGLTGGRLHIAHVSTKGSVEIVRRAKADGVRVTAETCPHYFTITEEAVGGYDTNARVNPPLRTEADVAAIREGLRDGTIDVIATDHAPHHWDDKNIEFDKAASGISGLETALALSLRLVDEGVLSLAQLVDRMSLAPSMILGLRGGTLAEGADADITVIDSPREFTVDPERFASLGRNTPFRGWVLKGVAVLTMVGGRVVHRES